MTNEVPKIEKTSDTVLVIWPKKPMNDAKSAVLLFACLPSTFIW